MAVDPMDLFDDLPVGQTGANVNTPAKSQPGPEKSTAPPKPAPAPAKQQRQSDEVSTYRGGRMVNHKPEREKKEPIADHRCGHHECKRWGSFGLGSLDDVSKIEWRCRDHLWPGYLPADRGLQLSG